MRLGVALVALWYVFWGCAYTINPSPFASREPEPTSFLIVITAWGVLVPCVVVAAMFSGWIVRGFKPQRSN
jgi:hypothetical protein